jgi:type VI secretion system VasI family protein
MEKIRKKLVSGFVAAALPSVATADVYYTCTFPTLPSFSIHYPESTNADAEMSVSNRPPQAMTRGQGINRLESATVDGYSFSFAPANSSLSVSKGESLIGTETGQCVRIGGPENETPLDLSALADLKPMDEDEPSLSESLGKWEVSQSTSQFDDSPTVVLSLSAEDEIDARFGGSGRPNIYLRCQENKTDLYVVAAGHFLSDIQGYGIVDYRLDSAAAGKLSMQTSTDNQALGLWSGNRSIPVIKLMFGKQNLSMRLTPYNESPKEFTFDISGLPEAIKPLREACNW